MPSMDGARSRQLPLSEFVRDEFVELPTLWFVVPEMNERFLQIKNT